MFCIDCGTKIPDVANYCYKCGAKTIAASSNGFEKNQDIKFHSELDMPNRRPFVVSLISIYLVFSGVLGFFLTLGDFIRVEEMFLNYEIKLYLFWRILSLITVGVVAYKLISIAVRLWKSRLKQVPRDEARRLVKVFCVGWFLGIAYQLMFVGFNPDLLIASFARFFLGGLLTLSIYFYIIKSKAVAKYFNLDIGPYRLILQPRLSEDQLSDLELEVRQQIQNFLYQSDNFRGVPIFSFRGDIAAIFRHNRLYFFANRKLAEGAINKDEPENPLAISEMLFEVSCKIVDA